MQRNLGQPRSGPNSNSNSADVETPTKAHNGRSPVAQPVPRYKIPQLRARPEPRNIGSGVLLERWPGRRQQRTEARDSFKDPPDHHQTISSRGFGGAPWRQMISSVTNAAVATVGARIARTKTSSAEVTTHSHTHIYTHTHTHTHATHPPFIPTTSDKPEPIHGPQDDDFIRLCPSDEEDEEESDFDVISLSDSDSDSDSNFDLIDGGDLSPRSKRSWIKRKRARRKREMQNKEIIQGLDDLGSLFTPTVEVGLQGNGKQGVKKRNRNADLGNPGSGGTGL